MPSVDPKRRHPEYDDTASSTDFLWRSYQGGEEYTSGSYLDKYPRETSVVFEERKRRAYFLNYVSAVIDAYISAVFKRDPVREVPPSFEGFVEDATGSGDSLTDFIREAMTYATASLKAYAVVDVSDNGDPYVHLLHPANLLDYAMDLDGTFLWALVAEKYVSEDDPFEDRIEEDRLRLWLPNEWMLFNEKGEQLDEGTNEAGEVPIVTIVPGNMPLPMLDIAEINRRVFNLCSQLDEILINVTFPQMYTQSGEGIESETGEAISPDVSPIVMGTSRILLLPDQASMPPGFLAPPDGPAKLHIEERERLISAIYSLAGLERKDPDSQKIQSGVAKAYDFRETNSRLASLAHQSESVEEEILLLLNAYGFSGEFNVVYQKDFNVRDFALMLDDYLKISETNLPPEAKRWAMKELTGQLADDASLEEQTEITNAVEALPDEAFTLMSAQVGPVNEATGEPIEGPADTTRRAEQLFTSLRSRQVPPRDTP